MATLDHSHTTTELAPQPVALLQGSPNEWPREANRAYRLLLRDLNAWCKDQHSPPSANPVVAEKAIRQAWSGEEQATW